MLKKLLCGALAFFLPLIAFAQPSPPPSPWRQSGMVITTDGTCVDIPSTVAGGCKGPGTLNASAIYVNGVAITGFGVEPRNTVLAGPLSGSPAAPTFRSLTNADLASPTITINSTACTLGAACTISAISTGVVAGSTTITGATQSNGLLFNSSNVLTNLATANNGLLVTSGSGVPSISTVIPNGVAATTQALIDSSTKLATTAFSQPRGACTPIEVYGGGIAQTATQNVAAIAAALTALGGSPGQACVEMTAGVYQFQTGTYTLAVGQSLTVRGQGQDQTQLNWAAPGEGLAVNYTATNLASILGNSTLFDGVGFIMSGPTGTCVNCTISGTTLTVANRSITGFGQGTGAPSDIVLGVANNGSGIYRLSLSAATSYSTGNTVTVQGTTGASGLNGNWVITKIDSTHIDLQGSTFSAGYSGGGFTGLTPYRITVSSTAGIYPYMPVLTAGVTGCTGVAPNGTSFATVVDGTHLDLINSLYSASCTGGTIAGGGTFSAGQTLQGGSNGTAYGKIVSQSTGPAGGLGTYVLDTSSTVSSGTAMIGIGGGTALTINGNSSGGNPQKSTIVSNVSTRPGAASGFSMWNMGVKFNNTQNVTVNDYVYYGFNQDFTHGTGLLYTTDVGGSATVFVVNNAQVTFANRAIDVEGFFQGAVITNSNLTRVNYGLYCSASVSEPQCSIANSAAEAEISPVFFNNIVGSTISGNVFYGGLLAQANSVPIIDMVASAVNQIVGNTFTCNTSGAFQAVGISFRSSSRANVGSANTMQNCAPALLFSADSTINYMSGVMFNNATDVTDNNGSNQFNFSTSTGGPTATLKQSGTTFLGATAIPGLTVTGSLTATGLVTLPALATQATNTVVGNATAGSASPTALAIGSCSGATNALTWTTNTGFGCNTISPGSGTVTSVSVTTANGVSGSVATATTTPAITLTLGAITPSSVNGNTITTGTGTLTLGASKVLTASNTLTFTGTDGSSVAFGTGGTVLYSGGALGTPSSGTLTNATGLPVAGIASIATNTVVGNATSGSASPTALAVGTCSTSASALNWTTNTGFGCNTAINAAQLGGATFAAPGAIGGGTPGSGAFTTLTTSSTTTVTSASASAFAVGLTGSTNPAFLVDASTALQVAGLKITGAVTGGTVALVATDSGSNTNVTWNAKGSGTFSINATATGGITLGRATTITTGGLSVSAGDVTVNSSSGALNVNGTNVRLSNAGPGGVVAGQIMFGTNVSTGATTSVLSFGGNIGGADGPLSTISGAVGGSTTHIGGELRLQGGISTAATGTGGAVTIYTAVAAAGTTPALVATFANDKSVALTGALSIAGALTYSGVTFTTVSGTGKLVGSINPAFTGSISSTGVYTENLNATALPAVITGTTMQVGQADTTNNAVLYDAFGAINQIIGRRSQGTAAVPTKLLSGNAMVTFASRGYDNSGAYGTASNATISLTANEDWNGTTNHGTRIDFQVTPNASGTQAIGMTLDGTGLTLVTASSDIGHTDSSVCRDTTSGTLYVGSGTLGVCLGTSSARYKNSIKPLGDGLEKITALHPKTFFYNKDRGDHGARMQVGFLAEDVVNVMPNLVDIDADARPNTVDILGMVPAMVNAIKELKASNDNLAAQVEILKRAVNK